MNRRSAILIVTGILLTAAAFCADIVFGSVSIRLQDVLSAVFGGQADEYASRIIMRFRIPKAVTALLAGAALGASGLQMQTLFRNPLAGPYVLGISSGATLGVAIFLLGAPLLGQDSQWIRDIGMTGAAWAGAACVFLMITAVSRRIKDIMVILILGMMFGGVAGAVVEILQYFSAESAVKSFVVWTMGSLGGVTSAQTAIMAPVIIIGLGMSLLSVKSLNLLLLGENYARSMGLDLSRSRAAIMVSTTLLAGTVTAFCGPIGFLGLAVPHIARMMLARADHRTLMPASMIIGALLMLLCDMASQLPASGMNIPINTVTALVGIPVIITVIVRNRKIF